MTENWKKPITATRYLQGPFSGNLCVQKPDFRIIMGKHENVPAGERSVYSKFKSTGIIIMDMEDGQEKMFDFLKTDMITRDDGAPIHAMSNRTDKVQLDMENFCNVETKTPAIFTRLTLKNITNRAMAGELMAVVRTGPESYLTGMEAAGYASYNPNPSNAGLIASTWQPESNAVLTDGEKNIELMTNEGFKLRWHQGVAGDIWLRRGTVRLTYELLPGESASLTFAIRLREDDRKYGTYEEERALAEKFWLTEIKRIKKYPAAPMYKSMVNNLVCQCLQFFAYYPDEGFIAPRQGGLDRKIWSGESVEFLTMLDRIGDFKKYTETAIDYFFGPATNENGEVVLSTAWASTTGCACRAAGYHVKMTGEAQFKKYRDKLYKAFKWMESKRAESYEDPDCVGKGIFPLGKGNDWPVVDQNWCITDCHNLTGYKELAEAFEMYNDPAAGEIRKAYEEYLTIMRGILADEFAKNKSDEEFLVTNRLGKVQTDPPMGAYFGDGPAMLIMADVMDPNSKECYMAEQYFINRGLFHDGLTGLMSDGFLRPGRPFDIWSGHMWYLSSCDSRWFKAYMARGERDKAYQTLTADLTWGMSDAYYMSERYADNDFTWTPYHPNASANGRTIHMMLDYFGEEK